MTRGVTNAVTTANQRVAAQIRAFMAARKKRNSELAELLRITPYTANRKVQGEGAFDLNDIELIAAWLQVPVAHLVDPGPGHRYTP
jgi:transcriptional regulator with XRE-family HTH domain